MKMSRQFIKISVMSVAMTLGVVAVAMSDEKMSAYARHLEAVVVDVKEGKEVSRKQVSDLCYEIYKNVMKENAKELIGSFGERLISLDFSNFKFVDRVMAVENVCNIFWSVWGNIPVDSDKERWSIRLKALAWEKQQLDRLLASPPEDNRPWPEKWRNPRAPYDSEKGQWDEAVSRLKSRFYRSDLRMCVQAAEDDRYSEEFRAWCFEEIERIIGRPLTDDDIMFKDDVLKCRAKRKKAKEGKTAK